MDEVTLQPIYYDADKTDVWRKLVVNRPSCLQFAANQKIPHLQQLEPHDGVCAIVGAAPSLKDHVDEIKAIKEDQIGLVITLNGAHKFMVEKGIPPNIQVMWEIDMDTVEGICGGPPHRDVYYYVCSHCPTALFRQLKGYHRVLWHCFDEPPEYQALIHQLFPGEFMVGGGFVTFFRALNIAAILGYRRFEIFACDCSFEGKFSHFDGYQNTNAEEKLVVAAGTKSDYRMFATTPSLSFLASEFIRFCDTNHRGFKIRVHGNGLLRYLHEREFPKEYEKGIS